MPQRLDSLVFVITRDKEGLLSFDGNYTLIAPETGAEKTHPITNRYKEELNSSMVKVIDRLFEITLIQKDRDLYTQETLQYDYDEEKDKVNYIVKDKEGNIYRGTREIGFLSEALKPPSWTERVVEVEVEVEGEQETKSRESRTSAAAPPPVPGR